MKKQNRIYDVDKLIKDKEFVEERCHYEDGAFGHCISLPNNFQISKSHSEHHNNLPYANILNSCLYFKEIFDSFKSEITSFRLLRRKAHSSYGLHNDKDMGNDIKRFQIPIVTNNDSWLCVAYDDEILEGWTEENSYIMEDFDRRFKGRYDSYQLEIGTAYHFDVTRIHTLFNNGDTDRVTLLIDVKVNDWLLKFIERNFSDEK